MALLEVKDLRTSFQTEDGIVGAVDGVSFSIDKGQTLGIVGESGCGKSVTCLTIMGLNPKRTTISSGEALWKDKNLLTAKPAELRQIRGDEISMIFQDPMTSLNPVHTIGKQLIEAVQLHRDVSVKVARARALELLKAVGIPHAERRVDDYPHQFSGGMRKRVMIRIALPNSSWSRFISVRICACVVTSSAVVGSSAISRSGSLIRAIAIITRWRIPPENWCG